MGHLYERPPPPSASLGPTAGAQRREREKQMLNTTTEANAEPMATAMARPAVTLEAVQTVQKLLLLFSFFIILYYGVR